MRQPAAVDNACNVFASNHTKHGFTLVEILAVVVILGILAVVVVPRVLTNSATAKINACYQNKASINAAVEKWHFDKGSWPDDKLSDISADTDYFPDDIPKCPFNGEDYKSNADDTSRQGPRTLTSTRCRVRNRRTCQPGNRPV